MPTITAVVICWSLTSGAAVTVYKAMEWSVALSINWSVVMQHTAVAIYEAMEWGVTMAINLVVAVAINFGVTVAINLGVGMANDLVVTVAIDLGNRLAVVGQTTSGIRPDVAEQCG